MTIWHLSQIGATLLVDANVLLNSFFVPEGVCASAMRQLAVARKVLAVEEITWRECERKIRQLCLNSVVADRLVSAFQNHWTKHNLLHLPPSPASALFDDHDQHLIAAASERRYTVLTADNGLRIELVRRSLPEMAPDDFIFLSQNFTYPTLRADDYTDRIAFQILLWAAPMPGSTHKMKMKRTLLSADGWGCLFYDNWTRKFCFELQRGATITTPFEITEEVTAFAISSETNLGNLAKAKSAIYIGNPANKSSNYIPDGRIAQPRAGGRIYLGSRLGAYDSWNGYIRFLSIKPVWLSKDMWRLIRSTPDFRPTYADADKLEGAIRRAAGATLVTN